MAAATIAGSAATASACPTAHPDTCRALVTTTFETKYRENAFDILGAAAGADNRICGTKHQSLELAIATFAKILVNRHTLLRYSQPPVQ